MNVTQAKETNPTSVVDIVSCYTSNSPSPSNRTLILLVALHVAIFFREDRAHHPPQQVTLD